MTSGNARDDVTLLDVLIDGFEKNEIWDGFHLRQLPMPDAAAAARKFASLAEEASRWKGPPVRSKEREGRRLVAWNDLEIRQAGRGVLVRTHAPWFDNWWHDKTTWDENPMGAISEWIEEERRMDKSQSGDTG